MDYQLRGLISEIMFSSNNLHDKEHASVVGATISLDAFEDIEHLGERISYNLEILS